jgi:perosamine synthetase
MFEIPVYKPLLNGNEKKYVTDCIESTWISSKGKYVSLFESEFANFIDCKFATTVSNGTVALHLALLSLGIAEGDEVIVPTFTYIASVNAIKYCGAIPIFVDSDPLTWQIDCNDVELKITPKTKAILAVHLYGYSCDLDALVKLADKKNIFLIEDCAEAIGTIYNNKHVGTYGHIATFSFFGNKTITTGEGGMVITNDKTLHERSVHFKSQGLAKYREYWHDVIGYNYRMTNICAAIGLAQLENINLVLEKKRKIANYYKELLEGTDIYFHDPNEENIIHSFWMCSILVKDGIQRDALRTYLEQNSIETRPLFYPAHTMPMYSKQFNRFPNAEDIGWRGLNLPSYPDLNFKQIERIVLLIKQFLAQ